MSVLGSQQQYSAESFRTWKTIKLGNFRDIETFIRALENSGVLMNGYAEAMLRHSEFQLASSITTVELVRVRIGDLGFTRDATRAEIYADAVQQGLTICPAEVGPQERMQYANQALNESLSIAMEPIVCPDGIQRVFGGYRTSKGHELTSVRAKEDYLWTNHDLWVFCRNKKSL